MKVPIKFRVIDEDGNCKFVELPIEGNISQLIGYDIYGNEIYEGDKLYVEYSTEKVAVAVRLLIVATVITMFKAVSLLIFSTP